MHARPAVLKFGSLGGAVRGDGRALLPSTTVAERSSLEAGSNVGRAAGSAKGHRPRRPQIERFVG
jgi:hypothetical protein